MKNSRRSDRQLAKALSVSQPTVTRTMAKLEKEGMIKEYTIVPDFTKLGYTLLAVTFVKLKESLTPDQTAKARDPARKSLRENYDEVFMLERGIGIRLQRSILIHSQRLFVILGFQKMVEPV
jgi:DNA-binding Lrp family transcriptional regulator